MSAPRKGSPGWASWRAQRLRHARRQRRSRWEFWPAWALYLPLVPRMLSSAVCARSLTAFAAANPGIPGGGLVGESKWDILRRLGFAHAPEGELVEWPLADADREAQLRAFVARVGLPVVVKPDVGQRGVAVTIARTEQRAVEALLALREPVVLQAFVEGEEYGLFYQRWPDQRRGKVVGITHKKLLYVRGDGVRCLEELVLADERAVCMAERHLRVHREHLDHVPGEGEAWCLVDKGTHNQGAVFFDVSHLVTAALEDEVDRICQGFEGGFHIGRFDVRAASVEALQAGEFTVLELNGVSSEQTQIYDPRHSLEHARDVVGRQWADAWAIGDLMRRRGVEVPRATSLVREWLAYLRRR